LGHGFALSALIAVRPSRAQARRLPIIGYLSLIPLSEPPSPERRAFLDGLTEEGLAPGRGAEIVYASAEGNGEFLDDVARDLVAKQPDVVVAAGPPALQALRRATSSIPVVILAVGDPVGMGLVRSLGRPGGNFTGSSFSSSDLAAKRVQLLHETAPLERRLAVVFDARNENARLEIRATVSAAGQLGLTALTCPFDRDDGLGVALREAARDRAELLYATFEGNIVGRRRFEVAEFALAQRWPSIGGWSGLADAGCLLTYSPDVVTLFRRGAAYVARILRGAKAAELPVEQASRFELVVNLKTAKRLGIKVPAAMLVSATRVIE
jgi:putative ABC transport system substrate-binding protein